MATEAERAAFLERFVRFGAAPSVESYTALFHEDATLFDDGMERPLTRAEIPAHIQATLALIPGFVMTPERWRARGPAVFVEARNEAKIAGERAFWRSVYRVELAGSLVLRGRRFFDRAPLLARIDPNLARLPELALSGSAGAVQDTQTGAAGDAAQTSAARRAAQARQPGPAPRAAQRDQTGATGQAARASDAECGPGVEAFVARCADAWREGRPEAVAALFREDGALMAPGLPRPVGGAEIPRYYRWLSERLRGARLAPRAFAGDEGLAFIEWQGEVPAPRGSYALGLVERFDLAGGRVLAARAYFDTAALARALAG